MSSIGTITGYPSIEESSRCFIRAWPPGATQMSAEVPPTSSVITSRNPASRRGNRPLLRNADPRGTLERLLNERAPVYAEADVTVESDDGPHAIAVDQILHTLKERGVVA